VKIRLAAQDPFAGGAVFLQPAGPVAQVKVHSQLDQCRSQIVDELL
jgi:hypothetical protein